MTRKQHLMPNGIPRWIRCYDNGENGDRYTVVYTNRAIVTGGEHTYVGMSAAPFHPQGVCQHGSHSTPIDRPRYSHLGHKIKFTDLPKDCQTIVIADYIILWDLESE